MRQGNRTRFIPFVIFTLSKEDPNFNSVNKLAVNSYVAKPFEFNYFTETIRQVGGYRLLVN
jgi:CheY-like chemotaxis protein